MSSFTDAFLKFGFYRDNTLITAAEGIGRNWQHVYIFYLGESLSWPYKRLVYIKLEEKLCLNKIGK